MNSSSFSLFGSYFLLFYIVPALGLMMFYDDYLDLYNINSNLWPLLVIPVLILTIYIIHTLLPKITISERFLTSILYNDKVLFVFSLIFLVSALFFFQNYSMSFRHRESMSEAGGVVILMFGLRALFKVIILYYLFKKLSGEEVNNFKKTILGLVIVSYAISINSSLDVIFIFVSFVIILNKTHLFLQSGTISSVKIITVGLLAAFVVASIAFLGIANKIGTDSALTLFSNGDTLKFVSVHILKRLSTHFISIITAGENYYRDINIISELIEFQFNNLINRFYILFGKSEAIRSDIWSVNRLNYLRLFIDTDNPKTGSSPGIIASVFYLPNLYLGLLIIAIFTVTIFRKFDALLKEIKGYKLNFIGNFILIFFMLPILDSPLDLINVLSPSFIYLFFFLFLPTK